MVFYKLISSCTLLLFLESLVLHLGPKLSEVVCCLGFGKICPGYVNILTLNETWLKSSDTTFFVSDKALSALFGHLDFVVLSFIRHNLNLLTSLCLFHPQSHLKLITLSWTLIISVSVSVFTVLPPPPLISVSNFFTAFQSIHEFLVSLLSWWLRFIHIVTCCRYLEFMITMLLYLFVLIWQKQQ